jgi:hypothetical protein
MVAGAFDEITSFIDEIRRRLVSTFAGVAAGGQAFLETLLFALPSEIRGELFFDFGPAFGREVVHQIREELVSHRGCPFRVGGREESS